MDCQGLGRARRFHVNHKLKTGVSWVVVSCVVVLLWQVVRSGQAHADDTITFTQFVNEVEAGRVKKVIIRNGTDVTGAYKDTSPDLHTLIPASYVEIYRILRDHGVD